MVKNVINSANQRISIGMAAALLSGSTLLSAVLGLFRDRLLVAQFGVGKTLDAYFAAFSLPDLLFYMLVSGALTVTFLPVLSERIVNKNLKSAWELSSSLINILALVTLLAGVLLFIFADPLMWLVAPGFDDKTHGLAVLLTRILSLNPLIFAMSSVFGSIQQAFGRFFFYALAPVIYNAGIIFGILVFSDNFGIMGVAWGVIIGAFAQMCVQLFGLIGLGFKYQMQIFWRNIGFQKVWKLIVPRSLDEGIDHVLAVIERAIASGLTPGSIAAYQYAFNLKQVPITLIGTSIATAAFPRLAERAAHNRSDLLVQDLYRSLRAILWLILPAAAIAILLRGYLVRLVYGFGDPRTASVLGWFAGAIVFQSLLRLVARIFYARQDTKRPLYASIAAISANIVIAIVLSRIFGLKGLAMAQSLVAAFEVILLLILLRRRIPIPVGKRVLKSVVKMMLATFVMALATYAMIRFAFPLFAGDIGFFILMPKFVAIVTVAMTVYLITSYLLVIPESRIFSRYLHNIIFRKRITTIE